MDGRRRRTRSSRAGILFPVSRIHCKLRKGNYARRIGEAAPVYLAAVLEYMVAEVLELAGNVARDFRRARINPRHLLLAIRADEELNELLSNVTIPEGGVLPSRELEPKPAASRKLPKVGGLPQCRRREKTLSQQTPDQIHKTTRSCAVPPGERQDNVVKEQIKLWERELEMVTQNVKLSNALKVGERRVVTLENIILNRT
ncbi:unnamed protein product [Cylicocyclus nassatus]|uniref:Histone H2A n=1 Tax=Cylicocyclus nassatus TaxID=53992 RepID=A0AA36HGN8_CYLNA|nr:unnamed protein product [Cylicocyclus nassatus]